MRNVFEKARRGLLLVTDTLAVVLPGRVKREEGHKELLVVRMDALGDLLLSLDAIRGVREIFPPETWKLTLAVDALWAELLEGESSIDRVLPVDRSLFLSSTQYRYRLARQVRSNVYDVSLNLVSSRTAMVGDALIRMSAAPVRVGWETPTQNISAAGRFLGDRWYTELFPPLGPEVMELERNAHFVRLLGHGSFTASLPRLQLEESWIVEARRILNEAGVGDRFAVLVPGTGPPPARRWPAGRWAGLAKKVAGQGRLDPVLVGSGGDAAVAGEVAKQYGQAIVNLTGCTRVTHLAAIISLAAVVVGSDTGPVHLAAALGTPAVCVLGGAFPGRFFPYTVPGLTPGVVRGGDCTCERWNCRRQGEVGQTFPCIDEVDIQSVYDEVVKVAVETRAG